MNRSSAILALQNVFPLDRSAGAKSIHEGHIPGKPIVSAMNT